MSGHCDAGMKVQVTVLPNDGLPVIIKPRLAQCGAVGGYCEFGYRAERTPVVLGVEVGGDVTCVCVCVCVCVCEVCAI